MTERHDDRDLLSGDIKRDMMTGLVIWTLRHERHDDDDRDLLSGDAKRDMMTETCYLEMLRET